MTKEKRVTIVDKPHRPSKQRIVAMLKHHPLSRGEYSWSHYGDDEKIKQLTDECNALEKKLLSNKRLVAISKRLDALRDKRRKEFAKLNTQRVVLMRRVELHGPTPKLIAEIAAFLGLPPE